MLFGLSDPIYPSDWWELLQAELKTPASAHPADHALRRCVFCFLADVGCGQSYSLQL